MAADDLTVGEVATFLESKGGEPVSIGRLTMRWMATVKVDPETMEWTEVAVADWAREERGF